MHKSLHVYASILHYHLLNLLKVLLNVIIIKISVHYRQNVFSPFQYNYSLSIMETNFNNPY
jgi:hypothetical protein